MISTADLQGLTAPVLAQVFQALGQTVTIRRPSQSDVITRAVLYQLDDGNRFSAIAKTEIKVMAWEAVFMPDALVRQLPFLVIDSQGCVFTPDGPTQDPGEQGVALIAHLLPLVDRTRTELLTFSVSSGLVRQPSTGNMVPAAGQPVQVPVRLVASDDPRIRDMVGADTAEVALIGRWGTLEAPQTRPAGVHWGSSTPLVLDGQKGTLTIKLAYPDPDLWQEQQFGQRFVATWRAG